MTVNSQSSLTLKKSNVMYLTIVGLWVLSLIWLGPYLYSIFASLTTLGAKIVFLILWACLAIFLFYGFYNLVLLLFWYLEKGKQHYEVKVGDETPSVALLHTIANDFLYQAALTCVEQDYPNFHVFLLDDSTDEQMKKQVDDFNRQFPRVTTVVRRGGREGFKAGNINNALKTAAQGYELFAIADSDSYLPPDFLTKTTRYFGLDERIGFVQANHTSNFRGKERFRRDLEVWLSSVWDCYNTPKNRYGMVMCAGHGVVIWRNAWVEAGGFPHVVSEDMAFTMKLREQGYYGFFAREIVCGEDFPKDLDTWRRRYFRWVKADLECLVRIVWPFMRAKNVSLMEKFDALTRMAKIPSGSLYLLFLLSLTVLLPPFTEDGNLFPHAVSSDIHLAMAWSLVVMTLMAASSPLWFFLTKLGRQPFRILRLISHFIFLYFGVLLLSTAGALIYLLTRRTYFKVTGETQSVGNAKASGFLDSLVRLPANHPLLVGMEMLLALFLLWVGLMALNFALLGIALSLVLVPLLNRFGWESKRLSVVVHLPFALIILAVVASLFGFLGPRDQYLSLVGLAAIFY